MSTSLKSIEIAPEVRSRIEFHVEREYPNEACGLLLGIEGNQPAANPPLFQIKAATPLANSDHSNPSHRYAVNPREYIEAEQAAARDGLAVLGVYHSHPDSPPIPSSIDSEFAFPGWLYWITPVFVGRASAPRIWLRTGKESEWRELE